MHFSRRTVLKATGLGALLGMTGGCDAVGGVFGRMFAVPPRDTTYFTSNSKFYVVNYADSVVSISREVNIEQWKLNVKGVVKTPLTLGWRDILNRDSYDQVSTLMWKVPWRIPNIVATRMAMKAKTASCSSPACSSTRASRPKPSS